MGDLLISPIFDYPAFEWIVVIFCGLVFGSFASALTYRVPLGLPWITKGKSEHGLRSACPDCKTLLKPLDLIPVLSWLISKGKCRHCSKYIPKTYPICEALTLLGFIGIYIVYGLTYFSLALFLMVPFLVALMMIDFRHMILPNQLVAIVFSLGVVAMLLSFLITSDLAVFVTFIGGALIFAFVSWLLGVVMKKILKKEALGFGDVKFFAAAGIWLGVPAIGYFCFGAGVIGVLLGLAWKKIKKEDVFPFGPALILSFYMLLLLQGSHFL